MRQQVNVTVTLTYDCDADLSRADLMTKIGGDIARLEDAASGDVEMVEGRILSLLEECEIYSPGSKKTI